MKIEVFFLGGQRIDQKRMKAWWRERGLRKGVERKFEEEDKEHRHLPLLVVQLPQGTAFLLNRFCSKGCSSEVLDSSRASR